MGPQDPVLNWFRLNDSQIAQYPLAGLHALYWGKPHEYTGGSEPFIPVPPGVVSMGTNLYYFRQYIYMEDRIKAFRDRFKKHQGIPPGVGLIGTPGIGKPVPIHLFIQARQPFREDHLSCLLSHPTTYAYPPCGLLLENPILHLHRGGCPQDHIFARFRCGLEIHSLSRGCR